MTRRSKHLIIVLACCTAAGAVLGWYVWQSRDSSASLLDTSELAVAGLTWEMGDGGCTVGGTLVNHSKRAARSAIVIIELRDSAGNVLATNPMVEVLDVPADTDMPFAGALRVPHVPPGATIAATVAAVRWE